MNDWPARDLSESLCCCSSEAGPTSDPPSQVLKCEDWTNANINLLGALEWPVRARKMSTKCTPVCYCGRRPGERSATLILDTVNIGRWSVHRLSAEGDLEHDRSHWGCVYSIAYSWCILRSVCKHTHVHLFVSRSSGPEEIERLNYSFLLPEMCIPSKKHPWDRRPAE